MMTDDKTRFQELREKRRIIAALNSATFDTYGKDPEIVSLILDTWKKSIEDGMPATDENLFNQIEAFVIFSNCPSRQKYETLTLDGAGLNPDMELEESQSSLKNGFCHGDTLRAFLKKKAATNSLYAKDLKTLNLSALNKDLILCGIKPIPYPTRPHTLFLEGVSASIYIEACRKAFHSNVPNDWARDADGNINPNVLAKSPVLQEKALVVPEALVSETLEDLYFSHGAINVTDMGTEGEDFRQAPSAVQKKKREAVR